MERLEVTITSNMSSLWSVSQRKCNANSCEETPPVELYVWWDALWSCPWAPFKFPSTIETEWLVAPSSLCNTGCKAAPRWLYSLEPGVRGFDAGGVVVLEKWLGRRERVGCRSARSVSAFSGPRMSSWDRKNTLAGLEKPVERRRTLSG